MSPKSYKQRYIDFWLTSSDRDGNISFERRRGIPIDIPGFGRVIASTKPRFKRYWFVTDYASGLRFPIYRWTNSKKMIEETKSWFERFFRTAWFDADDKRKRDHYAGLLAENQPAVRRYIARHPEFFSEGDSDK